MSGQVSRGSTGEYQADEQAGVARLRKLWGSGTALYLGAGSYLDSIYLNFVFYYMEIDKRE